MHPLAAALKLPRQAGIDLIAGFDIELVGGALAQDNLVVILRHLGDACQ